jgi:GTP1/Obg family GTP-binding protein
MPTYTASAPPPSDVIALLFSKGLDETVREFPALEELRPFLQELVNAESALSSLEEQVRAAQKKLDLSEERFLRSLAAQLGSREKVQTQ